MTVQGTPLKRRAAPRAPRPESAASDSLDPLLDELLSNLSAAPDDANDAVETELEPTPPRRAAAPRRAWLKPTLGLGASVLAFAGLGYLQTQLPKLVSQQPAAAPEQPSSPIEQLRAEKRSQGYL